MTAQSNNNNLNYSIDRTFTNFNRLFSLPFARTNEGDNRDSRSHYYLPNVEIKNFNVLIDGKSFFDLPVKIEEEVDPFLCTLFLQGIIYKDIIP